MTVFHLTCRNLIQHYPIMPLASNYEEKTSMIKDNSVADKCVKKNYPPLKKKYNYSELRIMKLQLINLYRRINHLCDITIV